MNLGQFFERIPEKVTTIVVIACGLLFAVLCGQLTGRAQVNWVFMLFGGFALVALALTMRAYVWILIPLAWQLAGYVTALPVKLTVKDLAVLYAFGLVLILMALKQVRGRPAFSFLDFLLLINLLLLTGAFFRNPVGGLVFQSDRVGGRPYLNVFIACLAYWVLVRMRAGPSLAKILPILIVLCSCVDAIAGLTVEYLPDVAEPLSRMYSSFTVMDYNAFLDPVATDPGTERKGYFGALGSSIVRMICSYYDPLTALHPLHFGRFCGLTAGAVLILLSGFRSIVANGALFFLLAGYFRTGRAHIAKTLAIGAAFLALIIVGQGVLYNLPFSVQRALSILPGRWDHAAVSDAKGSTEWRVQMWKDALFTDRYIENKWIGDGFGVDRVVLEGVMQSVNRGIDVYESMRENQAIMGGFHSGPISTIRVVGYVGLISFLTLLIYMARYAWQLVFAAKNTPYFPVVLFIGIPAIFWPFTFIFVFGTFDSDLPNALFTLGMLKMIQHSLLDQPKSTSSDEHGVRIEMVPGEMRERIESRSRPLVSSSVRSSITTRSIRR